MKINYKVNAASTVDTECFRDLILEWRDIFFFVSSHTHPSYRKRTHTSDDTGFSFFFFTFNRKSLPKPGFRICATHKIIYLLEFMGSWTGKKTH